MKQDKFLTREKISFLKCVAIKRFNVYKPRNLAKSVTVE